MFEPARVLAENVRLRMAFVTTRPVLQRNPVFRFFASIKLAVVLIAVLIVGAITGTIYESSFDAKVARAYVYGAPWFNAWLVLLGANVATSAISRWPWKKHHVAFLVTHLGIITLLTGSLIGRIWGIEGTITLFKGDPPRNRLLVDEHQLRVRDVDGIVKGYTAEFLHHPPSPARPRDLGTLASGARLAIIDYAPALDGKLNPKPLDSGGVPALHFAVSTAMMNQRLESWLLADDPQHGIFGMGLANIELKRGAAATPGSTAAQSESKTTTGEADLEESIFAFSKAPEEQIGRVAKGGSTGAKVRLDHPQGKSKGRLLVSLSGKTASIEVAENLGKEIAITDTPFFLKIDNYWADFRIENGQPRTRTDQPNNPAVLVTIRGKGVPATAAATSNPHGDKPESNATGGPPAMPPTGAEAPNHLVLFIADDGAITYELVSRKNGKLSGKLDLDKPLVTGWADWQLTIDKLMPHAAPWMDFDPARSEKELAVNLPDGVRVRLQQNGQTFEQWVPAGWQISVPTSPHETQVAYGWKTIPLPIGLELIDFEVKRNEGSDSPAGFKSTVRVSTIEGDSATGQCWMNNPFSFPNEWWRPWTGLTYKMSQASWNPDNLGQSTIQILRDPGWLLKWIGSLLIVTGVFLLFYVKKFRRSSPTPRTPPPLRAKKEENETSLIGASK